MTQREKILAMCVGAMLVLIVGYFAVGSVTAAFQSRQNEIDRLTEEIADKKFKIEVGMRAQEKIAAYEARSLPAPRGVASSRYREWLNEITAKAGLANPNVRSQGSPASRHGVYDEHKFTLTATGTLQELTEFLYEFYSVARLHRIRSMTVTPLEDSKDLRLSFNIDAGSLPTSPHENSLPAEPSNRLKLASLGAYNQGILERNLFGPPNNPPKFASTRAKDAHPNQAYSAKVDASDPDGDKLTYELLEGKLDEGQKPLPEASVSATGVISGKPAELGEYYVAVRVTDNGTPAKSVVERIRIPSVEPPVVVVREDPKFDSAKLAKLTGITESDGRRQIWISVRNEGKLLKLYEGDRVDVGSVAGVVTRIEPLGVLIEADGKRLAVSLGDFLADAEVLTPGE